MKTYKVTMLGATGAADREVIKILMECSFPIRELCLLASTKSAGRKLIIANKEYVVEETTENSFDGMDIVLGAAENDITEKYLPITAGKGAVAVDNSSTLRLDEQVPLIILEVNPQAVRKYHGIIVDPNCTTIIVLVALQPLYTYVNVERMVVPTYQAASGAGIDGMRELNRQVGAPAHGKEVAVNIFRYQTVCNLIPQIDGFNETGCSSEKMKMQNEERKTMSNPGLCVNYTCVCVPVTCPRSEPIMVEFKKEISVERVRELLQEALSVKLVDEPQKQVYPMPLDITDQDLVSVGRIHEDMNGRVNILSFWCCGDRARKGAVTNVTQIAKLVIQEGEKQQE